MGPFSKGGRSSAPVSNADSRAATFGEDGHHHSPLHALRRMGDKLKPHTAITTTEEEPGVSSSDQPAGTAVPVAARANADAPNAGVRADAEAQRSGGGRRSFQSLRTLRSRASSLRHTGSPRARGSSTSSNNPGGPAADGTTAGPNAEDLSEDQLRAQSIAQKPPKEMTNSADDPVKNQGPDAQDSEKSKKRDRLANTETRFETSSDQQEREQRVKEVLQKAQRPKVQNGMVLSPQGPSINDTADAPSVAELSRSNDLDGSVMQQRSNGASTSDDIQRTQTPNSFQDASENLNGGVAYGSSANGSARDPNAGKNSLESLPIRNGSSVFVDAPEQEPSQLPGSDINGDSQGSGLSKQRTASQPSPAAAGSLSPRNRFIGHRSDNELTGDDSLVTPFGTPTQGPPSSGDSRSNAPPNGAQENGKSATNDQKAPAGNGTANAPEQSGSATSQARTDLPPGANGDPDELDGDSDSTVDEEDVNIPEGSVPGLGIGDQDPSLPGEDTKALREKKRRRELKTSKDLEAEKARERFKPMKEELKLKRKRQAEYTGWRQVGGWDPLVHNNTREEAQSLVNRATLLESYVSDKYIGDWYQNTAIIIVTAFFGWLFGHLGFSVSSLSVILLFTATAYRSSVHRMRRNYRDDILREQLLERHEKNENESMEWLNGFLIKFWLIYEPSLSQMITQIGNEVLAEQTPGFIESMKLDKFTLGTKAPRIDFVRGFPRTDAKIVVIDMGASFTPNDTMDLTARQLQTKVNPKIQLGIRVGKAFLTKHFPVLLEDMSFTGKFRLRIRLMERPPHFQTIDFSFLEPPQFDFKLKPIGGDKFGFDINIIPGLSKFIKDLVNANLGPMFYAPNAFQVNVEQLLAGVGVMTGVGVLSVQIISASKLKIDSDGRVDPYVMIRSKDKKDLAHTRIKADTPDPVWNETINVIVTNSNDSVLLEVFDFDDSAPDRSVGVANVRISDLTSSEIIDTPITSGGQHTGFLKYVAHYAPVTMPSTDDNTDQTESPRDTKSGILALKITRARNLDPSMSNTAFLSPYAEIELSRKLIDSTKIARNTNDPEWNYSAEHIVLDKMSTLFTVRIRDHRTGHVTPPTVAMFRMKLSQLLIEAERGQTWFDLEDEKGEIKIEPQWKPANIMVGGSTNNYVEPIGVIRLNILNAINLRNLEHLGKIDPYARVFLGRRLVARTDWFKNELNPEWNEIIYVPVQNELQDLTIEVMDVEKHARDRSLGAFKIDLSKIIHRDEKGNYQVFISDKTFSNKLMLPNRGPKGDLRYTMEFYPAIPIVSPDERRRMEDDRKVIDLLETKLKKEHGDEQKLSDKERNELETRRERLQYSGIDMPIDEQLTYDAGVFAIAIVSLEGHHAGQSIRVTANNAACPIYTSEPFETAKRWSGEDCPDFTSGQIPLSSLRFELGTFNSSASIAGMEGALEDDEKRNAHDSHASEITIPCRELIATASYKPRIYELENGAKLELQARFFPVPSLVIDPREDISQNGSIEIYLKNATDVRPADPTGLSDPYCAFYLDNHSDKIYKSKIIKQTLQPVWEEKFRFDISDYKNSFVKAIINDWDMGNRDDFLGGYKFEFNELEPLVWKDYEVHLENIKKNRDRSHVKEAPGMLYLSLRFDPGHLQRSGDKLMVGAATVTRAAGGLAHAHHTALAGGAAVLAPHHILNKLTHHGGDDAEDAEDDLVNFTATVESVSGVELKADVQIRCFLLGTIEKEVFKSHAIKLKNGEATVGSTFQFKAPPDTELGVKLLALKSLHRSSDLGQTSTELSPGTKEVNMGSNSVISITVSRD